MLMLIFFIYNIMFTFIEVDLGNFTKIALVYHWSSIYISIYTSYSEIKTVSYSHYTLCSIYVIYTLGIGTYLSAGRKRWKTHRESSSAWLLFYTNNVRPFPLFTLLHRAMNLLQTCKRVEEKCLFADNNLIVL